MILIVTSHYTLFGTCMSWFQVAVFRAPLTKFCQAARHTSWHWWRIPRRRSAGQKRRNRPIQRPCWTCRHASPAPWYLAVAGHGHIDRMELFLSMDTHKRIFRRVLPSPIVNIHEFNTHQPFLLINRAVNVRSSNAIGIEEKHQPAVQHWQQRAIETRPGWVHGAAQVQVQGEGQNHHHLGPGTSWACRHVWPVI